MKISYKIKIGDRGWSISSLSVTFKLYPKASRRTGYTLDKAYPQNNIVKIQIINSKLLGVMYATEFTE